MKQPIRELSQNDLKQWLKDNGQQPFRAKQIQTWLTTGLATSFDEMLNLPKSLRELLAEHFLPCAVTPVKTLRAEDRTVKWLSELADGATVETVLIRTPTRNTVCISTQVGCAVRCAFCESGRRGFIRNLTATEIYDQVVLASHECGKTVDNVVVMGTGEPMHNLDNLLPALDRLCDAEQGLGMGARHITVSTSGIPAGIRRLADQERPWNLAISLHAPNDELRSHIIPKRHRHTIEEIMNACTYYRRQTGRMITFEYVLVSGLNDTPANARDLSILARVARAKVNLIPCNPGKAKILQAPDNDTCAQFLAILEQRGVQVTLRRRKGDRIQAACGQLKANSTPPSSTEQE